VNLKEQTPARALLKDRRPARIRYEPASAYDPGDVPRKKPEKKGTHLAEKNLDRNRENLQEKIIPTGGARVRIAVRESTRCGTHPSLSSPQRSQSRSPQQREGKRGE